MQERQPTRHNALNALRLLLAALVIVTHTDTVLGRADFRVAGDTLGGWAVAGFFAISGFLVAGSRGRTSLADYLRRRALRIMPGYWACCLVIAFGLAPLLAALTAQRWDLGSALGYVLRNGALVQVQPGIEGTLTSAAYPGTWNLSAWTLIYEFTAYVVLGLLLPRTTGRWALPIAAALLVGATILSAPRFKAVVPYEVFTFGRLGTFFFAGAVLYVLGRRVAWTPWLAALAVLALGALASTSRLTWFGALPLAYLLLWLGRVLPVRVGSVNDISYGVYLYGFPVQQCLATFWPQAPPALFVPAVLACVLPLAWLSWRFVERPAMRWRGRAPAPAALPAR